MKREKIRELIWEYYKNQDEDEYGRVLYLLSQLKQDLYFGPGSGEVGFIAAARELSEWWQNNRVDFYIDSITEYVMTMEPCWEEEAIENWLKIEDYEVRKILFGEAAQYV